MLIKRVDNEEQRFYEHTLYKAQDRVLALVDTDCFYLTGGTCLSRFYYHHRYSDDLDFFFRGDIYDDSKFSQQFAKVLSRLGNLEHVTVSVNEPSFKRAFIELDGIFLKIEFIYEPFPVLGERVKRGTFFIDTKENIAVNKITAVYSRKTAKDFFDLYFLLQDYSLEELIKKAEIKMIPPSFEELIMALESSLWEGQVVTASEIDEHEFIEFSKKLIEDLLEHAKQAG